MQMHTNTPSRDKCNYAIKTQIEGLNHIFTAHCFSGKSILKQAKCKYRRRGGMDHKGVHLIEGDQEKWD